MLSIRQALDQMLPAFQPLGSESVPLLECTGRVLAVDVHAADALPAFDHSAMDGYAVKHADVQAGASLPVTGEIRAGGVPDRTAPAIFDAAVDHARRAVALVHGRSHHACGRRRGDCHTGSSVALVARWKRG